MLEEVAKGASIQELQVRLRKGENVSEVKEQTPSKSKSKIPEDLVQIQAYIRWERAGKPNYSVDKQSVNLNACTFVLILCAICDKLCI